jgi:arsenite methyltransferase
VTDQDQMQVDEGVRVANRMRRFLARAVVGQLGRPHGVLSEPVARMHNRLDRHLNIPAINALAVRPGQTVLDVGFGGGVGITLTLATLERQGQVIGVDFAADMVRRAERIYADEIAAGRVQVFEASAMDLPLPAESVDRCLSVGSFYYWSDVAAGVREISRVVRPGGRVAMSVLPSAIANHRRFLPETPVPPDIGELADLLITVGFDQTLIRSIGRDAVLVIGQKSS